MNWPIIEMLEDPECPPMKMKKPHLVLKVRERFGKLEYRMATGTPTHTSWGARAYADLRWVPESWWSQKPEIAGSQAELWLRGL